LRLFSVSDPLSFGAPSDRKPFDKKIF